MKTACSLLFFLALLGTSFTSQAQMAIGIHGGFLSSTATGDGDYDNVTGYVIGIPLEISVGKAFAVQPEVNYLRRGYRTAEVFGTRFTSHYNVLEVPLLFKLGYVSENFTVAGLAGPAFHYTLSGNLKTEGVVDTDVKIEFDEPEYDDINRSNFYGIAGAQFGLPVGIGKLVLDGRYRFQLNDEDGSDNVEIRGRGVSATLGLMITIGDY